jgi:hypothetical protein
VQSQAAVPDFLADLVAFVPPVLEEVSEDFEPEESDELLDSLEEEEVFVVPELLPESLPEPLPESLPELLPEPFPEPLPEPLPELRRELRPDSLRESLR